MNSLTRNQPALRKAAIVISTLDTHSADTLLEKMPPESAQRVREIMMELADISTAEQDAVLREFMTVGGIAVEETFEGVELDPALADKLNSSGYADHSPTPPSSPPPFQFLHDANGLTLARHLERQHPQVIAVVTAHLPPQQAADLLKQFQPKMQADVLRRVADLDLADPEALRDIERELEALLSDELRALRNRQSGLATVSTILRAAGAGQNELLNNLARHEGELATQLTGNPVRKQETSRVATPTRPETKRAIPGSFVASRPKRQESPPAMPLEKVVEPIQHAPLAAPTETHLARSTDERVSSPEVFFEELTQLGDDDWAVLIRTVEPPIVLLALTGASEQLLQRITRQLSKREAQALRSRLQQTGPLRLSDIEQAQRHVAGLASQLLARGQIRMPERRGFAAAA